MSVLFDNIKPGDTVHYRTPQGVTAKGKVVMNRGTHLVLNRGRGSPQVVTDKNYVKHERGGKVVGALLSRLSVQEGSWDKEQAERNDPNYQWDPSKGPAPMLKKLPNPKAKKVADAIKAGNKLSPYKLGEPQMNAAKAFGWVKEATWQGAEDPYNWDPVMRKQVFDAAAKVVHAKQKQKGMPVPHELDKGRTLKSAPAPYRRGVKEETVNEVSKELAKRYVIAAVKDINYSSREAEGARTAAYADYMNKKAVKRSNAIAKSTKAMRAYKDHVWGKDIYKEDSKDAEGAAERVAKTKKHKKKLDELDSSTLASYVSKAIADRKKSQSGADMARRIHTPERAAYFVDKMGKRAAKRSAGIKTAVAKIASHLPAEPLKAHSDSEGAKHGGWSGMHEAKKVKAPKAVNWQTTQTKTFSVYKSTEGGMPLKHHMARLAAVGIPSRKTHSPYVGHTALEIPAKHEKKASKILYGENFDPSLINEVSAPGKEAWIKANKQRFIDRYGKEKGLRVLYAKAWKDSKNESVNEEIKRYTTHHDDYMVTSTTGPAGHTISVRHGGTLIAQRLGGKLITNSKSGKKDTKLQDVIKAHTDHPEVQKFLKTNEARESEWTANQQLSGQKSKKATGHYLVRDGRTLSGPHKPDEAVKAYRSMSDSKGVKIVHVKETHEFDVTRELISEAKVKEAAQKAINLKKKASGNKHVETEPKLDLPDRVNTTTLSADEGQDNAKV